MKSAHLWNHQLWTLLPSAPHPLNLLQPPGTGGERERECFIIFPLFIFFSNRSFSFYTKEAWGMRKQCLQFDFLSEWILFLMRPCSEIAPKKSPHLFDLFDITRVRSQMKDWFIAKLKRKVLSKKEMYTIFFYIYSPFAKTFLGFEVCCLVFCWSYQAKEGKN